MSRRRLRITPAAERDLDEATLYLANEADIATALRLFDAAHETFIALLSMPGKGKKRLIGDPPVTEVQQWPVTGFPNYLVIYRALPNGIDIIRVLHGAMDIDRLLLRQLLQ